MSDRVILESDSWGGPAGVQRFDETSPSMDAPVEHPKLDALFAQMMRKLGSMLDSSDVTANQSAMGVVMQLRQEEEYRVQREQQQKAADEYLELVRQGKVPQNSGPMGMGMYGGPMPYQGQATDPQPPDDVAESEGKGPSKTVRRSSSRQKKEGASEK